ncbi:MAG: DUF2236 domain-containing protein [Microthrixaceae bacterium]|nr:DUF2236 domain-containing protein [Microthrixaceae bacterium]
MIGPAKGALYDRSSLSWRLNSQALVLLGGPRAAILQVCDPGIAAGVVKYSRYRTDPLGRLEGTLEAMLGIAFGTPQRRSEVLDRLERVHTAVAGTLDDGTQYSALDRDRQFWVLATLTDTVIEVDRRYLGRMRSADRAAYYEESKAMATAFGIPDDLVPDDYEAFRDYFAERIATLEPTDDSREVAATLMRPRVPFVPGFAWLPFNLITIELMPSRMRDALGMRRLNTAESATLRAAQVSMRNSVAHLPVGLLANPSTAERFAAQPERGRLHSWH